MIGVVIDGSWTQRNPFRKGNDGVRGLEGIKANCTHLRPFIAAADTTQSQDGHYAMGANACIASAQGRRKDGLKWVWELPLVPIQRSSHCTASFP
jgi:hypothetical protein